MGGGGVLCRCEGPPGARASAASAKAAGADHTAALAVGLTEGFALLLALPLAALTCLRLYKERQAKGSQPMWARLEVWGGAALSVCLSLSLSLSLGDEA